MILRETLKHELDTLNEKQLSSIADYIVSLKQHAQYAVKTTPFWESATPIERSREFLEWVASLNKTGLSLDDEAFDRGTIYE